MPYYPRSTRQKKKHVVAEGTCFSRPRPGKLMPPPSLEDGTGAYRDVCRTEVANFGVPFTDCPTWLPFRCQVVQAIARHALASITLDAAESSTEAREEGMYP